MTTTDVALKCVIDMIDVLANIMRPRIVTRVRVAAELITFSPSQILSLIIRTEANCERRCDMRMKITTACEYLNSVVSSITFHINFHVNFNVNLNANIDSNPFQCQSSCQFHTASSLGSLSSPAQITTKYLCYL